MKFNNKCGAIFDEADLEIAIINKCKQDNKKAKDEYTITNREGYPSICIANEHYRVHSLLGFFYYGEQEVIHHKNGDKLNASKENLVPMTNAEHTRHHHIVDYVSKEHLKGFGNRVANIIRRNDVTEEVVYELKSNGLTIRQIAERLNCGYNTVCRRLGMKS